MKNKALTILLPFIIGLIATLGASTGFLFLIAGGIPSLSFLIQALIISAPMLISMLTSLFIAATLIRPLQENLSHAQHEKKTLTDGQLIQNNKKIFSSIFTFISAQSLITILLPLVPITLALTHHITLNFLNPELLTTCILAALSLLSFLITAGLYQHFSDAHQKHDKNQTWYQTLSEIEQKQQEYLSKPLPKSKLIAPIVTGAFSFIFTLATLIANGHFIHTILAPLPSGFQMQNLIGTVSVIIGTLTTLLILALTLKPMIQTFLHINNDRSYDDFSASVASKNLSTDQKYAKDPAIQTSSSSRHKKTNNDASLKHSKIESLSFNEGGINVDL